MLKGIHTLKAGMRVRWTKSVAYAVDGQRVARPAFQIDSRATTVIDEGTSGTVVADGDRVVVVIDEGRRLYGPIDEVEWRADGSVTASRAALYAVGVTGMVAPCSECGNASLFDSDHHHWTWTVFCAAPLDGGPADNPICAAPVFEEDLSEEAQAERREEIERDEPILSEIRDIIEDFNVDDDRAWFEETANEAAFKLLDLVNRYRAAEEV